MQVTRVSVDLLCISWAYTCDGKWDCPGGSDETMNPNCGSARKCKNLFKCRGSQKCIHLGDVCDNAKHCPAGDDEVFCSLWDLKQPICPASCSCLVLAINCVNVSDLVCERALPYHSVFIKGSSHIFFSLFTKVRFLRFVHSGLQQICHTLHLMENLIHFNTSFNKIEALHDKCFGTPKKLKEIVITDNFLEYVHSKAFVFLTQLLFLDLSNNCLEYFSIKSLSNSEKLLILSIYNNSLSHLKEHSFDYIHVKMLLTNDYRLCCMVTSGIICSADIPWYISCSTLLPNSAVKF